MTHHKDIENDQTIGLRICTHSIGLKKCEMTILKNPNLYMPLKTSPPKNKPIVYEFKMKLYLGVQDEVAGMLRTTDLFPGVIVTFSPK